MSTATVIPFAPESRESEALMDRYRDAYQTAETATRFAETVKFAGIFIAGLIFVSAILVFQMSPAERLGFPVVSASLVAGAGLVVLASQLWAMIFRVQGALLQVAVDSAVNSSPLLSNGQRGKIISWTNEGGSEEKSAA